MKRARQVSTFILLLSSFLVLCSSAASADGSGIAALGRKAAAFGSEMESYVVVFDAGSSGSRVHVFCFDQNLDLLPIGDELELFVQIKPGLSAYSENPQEAANSLLPLLEQAESVVPLEFREKTPVRLGATAGLRALGDETAERILQAVRELFQEKSSFDSNPDWVTVLDGTQEATYQWVTVNLLLGNLGKSSGRTVGVVDLGGGSVQMAYAISANDAASAVKNGEDSYVTDLFLKGTKYYLYVHSYMNYGLLAGRAGILKVGDGYGRFCILAGYNGTYEYGDNTYDASAIPSGSSYTRCRKAVLKALKVDEPCSHLKCTFDGVWNGPGGNGQEHLYVASFFFDKAAEVGFIDPKAAVAKVKPSDFEEAAKSACGLSFEAAKSAYARVELEDVPYLCMDLVYQYTLLVDGFALKPGQEITLVKQVPYGKFFAEAAWPLGSAVELVSSLKGHAYG